MNIDRFTDGARKSLADAMDIAEQHSHKELLPVHLALALLEPPSPDESQVGTVLRSSPFALAIKDAGGDVEVFRRRIKIEFALEESQEPRPKTIGISSSTSKILRNALSRGDKCIAVNHLIWSIVQDLEIRGLLDVANISDINAFDVVLSKPKAMEEAESNANGGDYMVNLTSLAGAGKIDRVIGRDEEIRYLIKILLHRTRNNPILVGERGVGKTSIVKGLAQRISAGDVPSSLLNWRILSLDTSSLTADIDSKEKLEERLCQIVKEIEGSKVATCLFIDNIHLLVESVRREHSMDSSDLLKSVLAKVKLHHCIATTTPAEFQKYTKKNKALEEQFVQISVKGPTIRDTVSILRSLKSNWETHYGVQISDDAITEAATLAGHNLPQSAIDLIDETAATVQLTTESGPEAVQGLERKNDQLKAEIQTLERDASESSVQYLAETRLEQSKIEEKLKPLQEQYKKWRMLRESIKNMIYKLESAKSKLAQAELQHDAARAADLKYYFIPELERMIRESKIDEDNVSTALCNEILEPDSKVFFTKTIGSEQIMKMVSKLTGEKTSHSVSNPEVPMGGNELSALGPREMATELLDPAAESPPPRNQITEYKGNKLVSQDRRTESSELHAHGIPPELGGTTGPPKFNDISRTELETSTPDPLHEPAATPILTTVEPQHEVSALSVLPRAELEGSSVPDLPQLEDGGSKREEGEKSKKDKNKGMSYFSKLVPRRKDKGKERLSIQNKSPSAQSPLTTRQPQESSISSEPKAPDTGLTVRIVSQGVSETAEKSAALRQKLQLLETSLGVGHINTLLAMNNLALQLGNEGQLSEAEMLHRRALDQWERVAGIEDPQTLRCMDNLGLLLNSTGRYQEAEEIHQKIVELRKKILGPEHRDTLMSMNNLALAHGGLGRTVEAEKLHRQVLELKKKVLGPNDPSTLNSMNNLASVLRDQGKLAEAEKVYLEELQRCSETLGGEHPDTVMSMSNLAVVLTDQGKFQMAERVLDRALEVCTKLFGEENPATVANMNSLAYVLENQGKIEPAIQMYQRALTASEKSVGRNHPSTQQARSNLASVRQRTR